jgi:putative restriction endonuclease
MDTQAKYISALQNLHRNSNPMQWDDRTLNKAPHKPILLLCIADLYLQHPNRPNRISPSEQIEEAFNEYWYQLYNADNPSTFALPFFHLQYEGFWHLKSENDSDAQKIDGTSSALRDANAYAEIDSELHELFKKPEWNRHFRSVIIAANFSPEVHSKLIR